MVLSSRSVLGGFGQYASIWPAARRAASTVVTVAARASSVSAAACSGGGVFEHGIAVVAVVGLAGGGEHGQVRGGADEQQRIHAQVAQQRVQMRAVERAQAPLGHDRFVRQRGERRVHLGRPRAQDQPLTLGDMREKRRDRRPVQVAGGEADHHEHDRDPAAAGQLDRQRGLLQHAAFAHLLEAHLGESALLMGDLVDQVEDQQRGARAHRGFSVRGWVRPRRRRRGPSSPRRRRRRVG